MATTSTRDVGGFLRDTCLLNPPFFLLGNWRPRSGGAISLRPNAQAVERIDGSPGSGRLVFFGAPLFACDSRHGISNYIVYCSPIARKNRSTSTLPVSVLPPSRTPPPKQCTHWPHPLPARRRSKMTATPHPLPAPFGPLEVVKCRRARGRFRAMMTAAFAPSIRGREIPFFALRRRNFRPLFSRVSGIFLIPLEIPL